MILSALAFVLVAHAAKVPTPTVTPQPIPVVGERLPNLVNRLLVAQRRESELDVEHEAWAQYRHDLQDALSRTCGFRDEDIWQYDSTDNKIHFKGTNAKPAPVAVPASVSGTAK